MVLPAEFTYLYNYTYSCDPIHQTVVLYCMTFSYHSVTALYSTHYTLCYSKQLV
ncbi:MAG: hypothetical protein ACI8RD_003593 [Bacillariaceae sp.]|jgi:hypothetical protein